MIDDITRQRILDTAQIVEVVGEFVQLKKRGANYVGLCPFHKEKTPSFSVSESKGIFKCFGCGKAGNVVNFLMEHEKISYTEALRWLAAKYHIEIQEKPLSEEDIARKNERESLLVANKFAYDFFVQQLFQADEGKSVGLGYLRDRGIRDDIIQKFVLGYCPSTHNAFSKLAISKGFKPDILQKAGLINKGNLDNFTSRIVFPIFNLSGNVVGFSGRRISNDESTPKYYNTPETEIFHKGQLLYGLFQSKKAIAEKDCCYLVEGNIDVLAMHQMNVENAVASLGTALTSDQIALIKRFTKNVILLYDADKAGINAAMRGIDLLLQEGMAIKIVLLPEKQDPDSFSKEVGQAEFVHYLENNAQDFILFKLNVLLKDAKNDPIKRSNAFKEIARTIALIPDKIFRAVYIKEAAKLMNIGEENLYAEVDINLIKKLSSPTYSRPAVLTTTQTPSIPSFVDDFYVEEIESEILRILLQYGNMAYSKEFDEYSNQVTNIVLVAEAIINDLLNDELEFKNLVYKQVFEILHQQLTDYKYIDEKSLVYHENEQVREIVATLLSTPYYSGKIKGQSDFLSSYYKRLGIYVKEEKDLLKEIIKQLLLRYKYKLLEIAINDSQKKIQKAQDANLENEYIDEELRKIMKLTKIIQQIAKELNMVLR